MAIPFCNNRSKEGTNTHWSFHRRNTHNGKRRTDTNVKDSKDTETIPTQPREPKVKEEREKKERIGSHWLTMDPRVEMAFFTSSTFPAENLNTGETEACWGNCSFSRVSFLVCT